MNIIRIPLLFGICITFFCKSPLCKGDGFDYHRWTRINTDEIFLPQRHGGFYFFSVGSGFPIVRVVVWGDRYKIRFSWTRYEKINLEFGHRVIEAYTKAKALLYVRNRIEIYQ